MSYDVLQLGRIRCPVLPSIWILSCRAGLIVCLTMDTPATAVGVSIGSAARQPAGLKLARIGLEGHSPVELVRKPLELAAQSLVHQGNP